MNFFDASTAVELRPIAAVLADLKQLAERQGVGIMVVGAVARDILVRYAVGGTPGRATTDIDVAAAVGSWSEVARLTQELKAADASGHKFILRDSAIDIIPFGEIESEQRTILWPNDHLMNVFGFSEALASAVTVKLPGGFSIAVASLPAQSLLKLFAWSDRRYRLDRRDAIDLSVIMLAFHDGLYLDQLYESHVGLLEKHDFDVRLAGAERLGQEARRLVGLADRRRVIGLLGDEELMTSLAADMPMRLPDGSALITAYRGGFEGRD